jgi:hypothetical protein
MIKMKKMFITFLFNNGVEKTYEVMNNKSNMTEEMLNEYAEQVKEFFKEQFNENINGQFSIGTSEGAKVVINATQITAVEIKIA